MKRLLLDNRLFFFAFGLFLLVATIGLLVMAQGDMVLYFSDNRAPFWDVFFSWGTRLGEGGVIAFFVLILLFYKYRYAIVLLLLSLTVMIVSFISKSIFAHPRPLAYFRALGMEDQLILVENIRVNTGATSFPSGHTMAGFALYCFLALVIPNKKIAALACFLMALTVGVSRVYLVQHFLKDIYLGSLLGVALAVLWFLWQQQWRKPWLDRSLMSEKRV